jgi:cytochrome c peroxidase
MMLMTLLTVLTLGARAEEADKTLGLPPRPEPAENPTTKAKAIIGSCLFHDKRLSTTGTVSCNSCHDDDKAFTDKPLRKSLGVNELTGTRNAPSIINSAFSNAFFWDGRSATLEEQSLHPFANAVEMGVNVQQHILDVVRNDPTYQEPFQLAFGKAGRAITMKEISMAIAAYERSLLSGHSRFDRWYFKREKVLSQQEIRGFKVFSMKGQCVTCHTVEKDSALFTDNKFHNNGIGISRIPASDVEKLVEEIMSSKDPKQVQEKILLDQKISELGRFVVDFQKTSIGAFKTPTLRDVAMTAPYMHDGSLNTLEDVVELYDQGGVLKNGLKNNPYLDPMLHPLHLSHGEKRDLVAFLKTLTGAELEQKGRIADPYQTP